MEKYGRTIKPKTMKTKTSPGFLASVNTEFLSKKMEFPLEWERISQSNF